MTLPQPERVPSSAQPLDLVFIEGLTAHTVIGIHADELQRAQPVVIELQAGVPHARACETDRIHDTIDYAALRERLLQLMAEHRVQLLEALAERVAAIVLNEFGARWVQVKLTKPRKFADVAAVGVLIERRATEHEPAHQARGAAVLRLIGSGMVPAVAEKEASRSERPA